MKTPARAAFLIMALLTPFSAAAGTDAPVRTEEEQQTDQLNAAEVEKARAGQTGGTGGLPDLNAGAPNTPPSEQFVANVEASGKYKAIKDPSGAVLGWETADGKMCLMPNHPDIMALGGGAAADPIAGMSTGGLFEDVSKGAQQKAAAEAGNIPKPGDLDFIGPLEAGFCQANPSTPACAGDKEKEATPPEEVAQKEVETAQKDFNAAAEKGDREAGLAAITARDEAEARAASGNPGFGTQGADVAFDGPQGGNKIGGGGDSIGAQGEISGGPAPITNGQVKKATKEQEYDATAAFLAGLKSGPLDGPRDRNVRSVAQTAQMAAASDTEAGGGISGTMQALKRFGARLGLNLESDAANEGGLGDQLGAHDPTLEGGREGVLPSLNVVQCGDTLDGAGNGRTSRRIGSCTPP